MNSSVGFWMTGWRSEHIVNNSFVKEILLFAEHSGTELRLLNVCMHSESESDGVSVLWTLYSTYL